MCPQVETRAFKEAEVLSPEPNWLGITDKWLLQVCETSETVVETVNPKFENQLLAKEEEKNLTVDQLLHKYLSYWNLLRVTAYVK